MKKIYFTYKYVLWYSSKWIEYKRFEKKVKYNVILTGYYMLLSGLGV